MTEKSLDSRKRCEHFQLSFVSFYLQTDNDGRPRPEIILATQRQSK